MLREISGGISSQARDRLRDLREVVQARRRDPGSGPAQPRLLPAEIGRLLGHAANALDDTMLAARSLSVSIFPELSDERLSLLPLDRYFKAEAGGSRFRRQMYRAARIAGARIGPHAAGMAREGVLHDAFAAVRRQGAPALADLARGLSADERAASAAGLCATLLVAIVPPSGSPDDVGTLIGCYAPGLLASAWSSVDGRPYEPQTLELAMLAVGARRQRLCAAHASADPQEELAACFRSMLLHLI